MQNFDWWMDLLTIVSGWIIAVFIGLLGLLVLWRIFRGEININDLLLEGRDGKASLARFQFLIFTFVIALSLFLVIAAQNPPAFPDSIPAEIFALLGISGGSYLVSKGVQSNQETQMEKLKLESKHLDEETKIEMEKLNIQKEAARSGGDSTDS
jgi:uncharacterized BrkB/YihY/UPF0761 family membrane protein